MNKKVDMSSYGIGSSETQENQIVRLGGRAIGHGSDNNRDTKINDSQWMAVVKTVKGRR